MRCNQAFVEEVRCWQDARGCGREGEGKVAKRKGETGSRAGRREGQRSDKITNLENDNQKLRSG